MVTECLGSDASYLGFSAIYCMLVLVVLPLVRVCLTLLHVSIGIVAPYQGLSAIYCLLVKVVLPLVRICLTLLHVSHGSHAPFWVCLHSFHVSLGNIAPYQGLSALYCKLVLVVLPLVRFYLHSIAC